MTGRAIDLDDDMLTPERVADPYPFFAELRASDPVHWSDRYRAWFISRWDDVFEALRDPRFSSDRVKPVFDTKLTDEQRAARKPMFDILQYGRSRRRRSPRCGRASRRWSPSSSRRSATAAAPT